MEIDMKEIGEMDKDQDKEFMNILMEMFMKDNGFQISNKDLEDFKWQLEIDIKANGLLEKRMEQVFFNHNSGKYIFANGDIYQGQFENGNRQGTGTYTWTD